MATIYTPNTVMVDMVYTISGRAVENVFHVDTGHPATKSNCDAIIDMFEAWHNAYQRTVHHAAIELDIIVATALDGAGAPQVEREITSNRAGFMTGGQFVPLNTSLVLKWTTGLSGRSYRGRTHHVGFSTDVLASWIRFRQDYVTDTIAVYQALLDASGAAAFPLVVASKYSGIDANKKPIPRPEGITTLIVEVTADTKIDSQRRRTGR